MHLERDTRSAANVRQSDGLVLRRAFGGCIARLGALDAESLRQEWTVEHCYDGYAPGNKNEQCGYTLNRG